MGIKKGREPTQTSTGLPKLSSTCVLNMASTSCEVFENLKNFKLTDKYFFRHGWVVIHLRYVYCAHSVCQTPM